MEGRFQSRESSEVLGGHNVTNLPESERLAGHIVVDSTRQFIFKLSQKYASPSGIVDVNEIRTWETDSEGNSFESLYLYKRGFCFYKRVFLSVIFWISGNSGSLRGALVLHSSKEHSIDCIVVRHVRIIMYNVWKHFLHVFLQNTKH